MNAAALAPRVEELTIEQLRSLSAEMLPRHYAEVNRPAPAIDWESFERLELAGMTIALGAYVGDELVGYSLSFAPLNHLHYSGERFVHCDLFYVEKSWRGRQPGFPDTIGNMLRAEMLRAADRFDAKLCWRAKPGSPMAFWLERHGCSMEEIVYVEGGK